VVVNSDPLNAEVWIGNDKPGVAGTPLTLAAGVQDLVLRYQGLDDCKLRVQVAADRTLTTNVVFAYGSVVIQTEPSGAKVFDGANRLGTTPYTNPVAHPGTVNWRLVADDYVPTNVILRITNHQSTAATVQLERGQGTLALASNLNGARASVDGGAVVPLPTNVIVEANRDFTVIASYRGQKTNTVVRVKMGQVQSVDFSFDEMKTWTNQEGMTFVWLPRLKFWVGTAHVTPDQYEKVMGVKATKEQIGKGDYSGSDCVKYSSYANGKTFADKLAALGRPPGCDAWGFAIPTTDQWEEMSRLAATEGIGIRDLRSKFYDGCVTNNSPGTLAGRTQDKNGNLLSSPFQPSNTAAIRMVLVNSGK
jgi:formylglycine-generating enzyme required for sulfatase activity